MDSDADTLCGWVAPFGDPGINDRSHLPRAFRSVPRPSSPLSAKASTRCPYFALERHTQRQGPSQISHANADRADIADHNQSSATNLSSQKTLRRGIPHAARRQPSQADQGRTRSPATVTQLASLRLSISIMPRPPYRPPKAIPNSSPRRAPRLSAFAAQTLSAPIAGEPRGESCAFTGSGGDRNRTDDPLLAKQVLSQLSYTPGVAKQHRRDRPNQRFGRKRGATSDPAPALLRKRCRRAASCGKHRWWAREDLNLRPHAYQARALTS